MDIQEEVQGLGRGGGEVAEFTLARNEFRMPGRCSEFLVEEPGGRWGPKVRDRWGLEP